MTPAWRPKESEEVAKLLGFKDEIYCSPAQKFELAEWNERVEVLNTHR